jgi:hypothetical protein
MLAQPEPDPFISSTHQEELDRAVVVDPLDWEAVVGNAPPERAGQQADNC